MQRLTNELVHLIAKSVSDGLFRAGLVRTMGKITPSGAFSIFRSNGFFVTQATLFSLKTLAFTHKPYPYGWQDVLSTFFSSDTGKALTTRLQARLNAGAVVFPADPLHVLREITPQDVRVVILGQDPYHGPGQAVGAAFSVPKNLSRLPPSLKNIFKEVAAEFNCPARINGDLTDWVKQGVLLLNTVLTVECGLPASHARYGWQVLTDALLAALLKEPCPRVFMLWGAHAQAKETLIRENAVCETLILKANHPYPLSARRTPVPFFGCGHFVLANRFLVEHGKAPVLWAGSRQGTLFKSNKT